MNRNGYKCYNTYNTFKYIIDIIVDIGKFPEFRILVKGTLSRLMIEISIFYFPHYIAKCHQIHE